MTIRQKNLTSRGNTYVKKNRSLIAPVLGKTGQEGYFNQLEKKLKYGHTGLDRILAEKKIGSPAPCSQSAETRKTSG
jgi:hypothetical protein